MYKQFVAIDTYGILPGNRTAAVMAEGDDRIVTALNRLTDREFTDALSASDRAALSDLVSEYFCDTPEENGR